MVQERARELREQQRADSARRRDHFEASSSETADPTLVVPFTIDNVDVIPPDFQFRSNAAGIYVADDEPRGEYDGCKILKCHALLLLSSSFSSYHSFYGIKTCTYL